MRKHNPIKPIGRIATLAGVMAILLSLTTACHRRPAILQYQSLPLQGWRASDTLRFAIDSLSVAARYNLHAAVRTSAARPYAFRQLVLEVRQQWHPDSCTQIDTVEVQISAPDGKVEGNGVAMFTYEVPTCTLSHRVGSRADIQIRHLMRRSPLQGISDVGIHLKKVD